MTDTLPLASPGQSLAAGHWPARLASLANILANLWTNAVAYLALLATAGLSMAGNVADVYRTRGQATDTLDIVIAVAWPALVIITVHMFVSPRWDGLAWPMQTLRWAGCLAIGGMAMLVSWLHLHELLVARSQPPLAAVCGPLALDLMAIMATALLLAGRRATGQDPALAKVGQDVGQLATWIHDLDQQLASLATRASGQEARLDMASGQAKPDHWPDAPVSPAIGQDTGLANEVANYLRVASLPAAEELATRPARLGQEARPVPDQAAQIIAAGLAEGMAKLSIDEVVANECGVSTRVARRWRGQLASDPGQ